MDREDMIFIKIVGDRALKHLRTKNPRLFDVFMKACGENNEKPARVLGKILLKFTRGMANEDKSVVDSLLMRNIRVSAITKKDEIFKRIDEMLNLRKKLYESSGSTIDRLLEQLIERELSYASFPHSFIQQQNPQQNIVIDTSVLSSLSDQELDALETMVKEIKESRKMVEEMKSRSEEVKVDEEEEADIGDDDIDKGDEGIVERSEGTSE
ncbi:MAG: hypothetical protein QW795_07895 [Candidatus Bathyarchaeia archaeon]